jgi:hypothetical protein
MDDGKSHLANMAITAAYFLVPGLLIGLAIWRRQRDP